MARRLALIVLMLAVCGCGAPQLGADEESFKSVDALYTAVTARRVDLLTNCETKLRERHDAGHLPDAAWNELNTIISKSRDGKWESAAERLYDFMKRQEMRDGMTPTKSHKR